MIFSHTIEQVLAGRKSQTARIWKDNYSVSGWRDDGSPQLKIIEVSSVSKATLFDTRKLYYVGQELAVQPARGSKGIARIRVLELAKRDVRTFTLEDIVREAVGEGAMRFIELWASMHDKAFYKKLPTDKTNIGLYRDNYVYWCNELQTRPAEFYQALVIRFELVGEAVAA